eukprot:gene7644-13528_t
MNREYDSAIQACGGDAMQAVALLAKMRERGLVPSTSTYNSAIKVCAKGYDPDKVVALLAEMRERGLVPSTSTYNLAIDACATR